MSTPYAAYFGFKSEPFTNELSTKNLLRLPGMVAVKERLDYTSQLGGIMVVTGEIGSGKSTSLRWAQSHYHPSQYLLLNIVATGGQINELYKQIVWSMGLEIQGSSRAKLTMTIKNNIQDIVTSKKQKILLMIDEANLLNYDTFAEIHVLTQFHNDSKNMISLVLAGQPTLMDKLRARMSAPLASRVIAKTHLTGLIRDQMAEYLEHHLTVAGINKMLFSEQAITAIHQGSGGLLRKANHLARGSLIAACIEKKDEVSAEHVRIASTELI
jgi:general secretion pathway protein A